MKKFNNIFFIVFSIILCSGIILSSCSDNNKETSGRSAKGNKKYGGTGSTSLTINHGDCNFDNKVNVQDLALVGGNIDLTSETAYGVTNANIWTVQAP